MACAPSKARAAAISPSSSPRCTPAVAMDFARRTSSLTINGTPAVAHNDWSADACSWRSASPAVLLRYCSQVTPAASNGAVRAIRRAVSVSSGVIRYRPRGAGPGCGQRAFIGKLPVRDRGCDNGCPLPPHYPPMTDTDESRYQTWMCVVCGLIYDEARGMPEEGLAPGTRWKDVPDSWTCPDCGVGKDDFEMVEVD